MRGNLVSVGKGLISFWSAAPLRSVRMLYCPKWMELDRGAPRAGWCQDLAGGGVAKEGGRKAKETRGEEVGGASQEGRLVV